LVELLKKRKKTKKDVENALRLIEHTDAVETSKGVAKTFSEKAKGELRCLKNGIYKTEMIRLADYIIERNF